MSKIKQRRVLNSVLVVIIAFLFGLISLFALLPKTNVFAQADSGSDADVGNYSSMSIVGSVPELGSWDTTKAIGPLFNDTPTIGVYPTWFYDISVPANTQIEYKFIKIDGAGNVVWESGMNHVYTTPASNTGEVTVNWQ